MYVSIPPRFGVSAAAGAATVATQKTAPRLAAANPDVLIISSLPPSGCWDGSVAPSSTAFSGEACWNSASKRRSSTQVSAPRCRPPGKIQPGQTEAWADLQAGRPLPAAPAGGRCACRIPARQAEPAKLSLAGAAPGAATVQGRGHCACQ